MKKTKKPRAVKVYAVIHDDYIEDIRWYGGNFLISNDKKDLLRFVSKKRGGIGDAINEDLGIYTFLLTPII